MDAEDLRKLECFFFKCVRQSECFPKVFPHLFGPVLSEDEHPEASREEEEDRHEDVEGRQGHLARGQVAVVVLLLDIWAREARSIIYAS